MLSRIHSSINDYLLSPLDVKVVRRSSLDTPAKSRITGRKVIFFHPPKCGGTSVSNSLSMCFGKNKIERAQKNFQLDAIASRRGAEKMGIPLPTYREMLLCYALEAAGIQYISGHFSFSSRLLEERRGEWDFVTLLRNPLDRVISSYYYNRHKADREHFPINTPIEEWLETENARKASTHFLRLFNGDVSQNDRIANEPNGSPLVAEGVRSAIDNLSKFSALGETSRMSQFVARINQEFNTHIQERYDRKTPQDKYRNFEDQPRAIQRRIRALCGPDLQIYEAFFRDRHRDV